MEDDSADARERARRYLREAIAKATRLDRQRRRLEDERTGPGPYDPWDSGVLNIGGIRAVSHCPEPESEDDLPGWSAAQAVLGWEHAAALSGVEPDVHHLWLDPRSKKRWKNLEYFE